MSLLHCVSVFVTDCSVSALVLQQGSISHMMTSSNGNIFRVTGPLCGPGEFPTQRPVTRSFDVFFDLCQNKQLSKQSWGWWFETPSWSLWRQCNEMIFYCNITINSKICFPTILTVILWSLPSFAHAWQHYCRVMCKLFLGSLCHERYMYDIKRKLSSMHNKIMHIVPNVTITTSFE